MENISRSAILYLVLSKIINADDDPFDFLENFIAGLIQVEKVYM